MRERDKNLLWDMLEAAQNAVRFAYGRVRSDLDDDVMLAYAIARAIQIVGEAANRIGDEARAELPEIPWHRIIGMRHKLVHDYISVDNDIMWDVVTDDLPELIRILKGIVGS